MATAKETEDTEHRLAQGTVSQWTCVADCGMQLSKRKSSPHPRGHDVLGANCNQCQNDCGLTGENLRFDPCIFCHLSSRVKQRCVTPCSSFRPDHAHPRPPVRRFVGSFCRHHRHQSVPVFVPGLVSNSARHALQQQEEEEQQQEEEEEQVRHMGHGRHLAGGGY